MNKKDLSYKFNKIKDKVNSKDKYAIIDPFNSQDDTQVPTSAKSVQFVN